MPGHSNTSNTTCAYSEHFDQTDPHKEALCPVLTIGRKAKTDWTARILRLFCIIARRRFCLTNFAASRVINLKEVIDDKIILNIISKFSNQYNFQKPYHSQSDQLKKKIHVSRL